MKTFTSLKDRLNTINKKGFLGKETTTLMFLILGLFITTVFIVSLLPTIISNLTGYGIENLSTGLYFNGSTSCPDIILGDTIAGNNCTFALQQATGSSSIFITTIVPLFVIFGIFFLVSQKVGFNLKGTGK